MNYYEKIARQSSNIAFVPETITKMTIETADSWRVMLNCEHSNLYIYHPFFQILYSNNFHQIHSEWRFFLSDVW